MSKWLYSNTIGVQIFLILSALGSVWGLYQYDLNLKTLLTILTGYFLYGCLGIVVCFHRYWTHYSFSTNTNLIKIFSILGCLSGTGSPIAWVSIHINHHLKSDKPNDPHSPHYKGLKIFLLDYANEIDSKTKFKMKTIIKDEFQQYLHRYYFLILLIYDFVLYLIGDIWLVIFFHWLPSLITAIMSNVVNYVGHKPLKFISYRNYNLSDLSVNNWLWALPSWGESWHNNHHRFPKKYYYGNKWYEFDISGLIIKLIKN